MLIYNLTDAYWLSQFSSYALAVPRQTWPMFLVFNSIIIGIANANLANAILRGFTMSISIMVG